MKIEAIEPHIIGEWLVVRVHTEEGISGLGEGTYWANPSATADEIRRFSGYLVGKDPLRMDYHWQYLYRSASFRSPSISAALSAIDIALWDIAGKHFDAPVHTLLGGKHRDKIRMCALCAADTVDAAVASTTKAAVEGHTAVKITPFPRDFAKLSHARLIKEAVDRVAAVREAVGPDVDIGLEIHRNLTPAQAIALAKKLEPFDVLYYEDPVQPDSIESMAEVASKITLPIATGERHHSIFEFKEFLQKRAANDLKLDVGLQGGFSQCKKAAGMAEAFHATVSPHNARGPALLAAHVQLCAAIPNFLVLEYRPDPKDDMVKEPLRAENGYIAVPDTPGIGVEFSEDAHAKYPATPRVPSTALRADGSVGYN